MGHGDRDIMPAGAAAEAPSVEIDIITANNPTGHAVVLQKISGVATWKPNQIETCAICYNKLTEPSLTFESGSQTDEGVTVARGTCGHEFHQDCINEWLEQRETCPSCTSDMKFELESFDKIAGADAYFD